MAIEFVIDSSALLAYVYEERGSDVVESILTESAISVLNLSETYAVMLRKGTPSTRAEAMVSQLGIPVIGFDRDLAMACAALELRTRALGISLADRACLATARSLNATAVTCDSIWAKLDIGVRVRLIR